MAATESTSPEIRKDKVNNRWVIFSPARSRRPSDLKSTSPTSDSNSENKIPKECPFCIGHEHQCAPEIFRFPSQVPPTSDWTVRVIQNLYPALSREIDLNPLLTPDQFQATLAGFGFHDVIIESPSHSIQLSDLSPPELAQVLLAHTTRIQQIALNQCIKYIQVFKNHGTSAGASMSHSHSQIIGLPVVPPNINDRLNAMNDYFNQTGKCSLCEIPTDNLLIDESSQFISMVPFAASHPFEIWIVPKEHTPHFHELDSEKAVELGGLLKLMLQKMNCQLNNPPYNFMIHTSPLRIASSELPYSHWFLQIIPQLTGLAGFEMATGCYINPVFPEDAAKLLRQMDSQFEGSSTSLLMGEENLFDKVEIVNVVDVDVDVVRVSRKSQRTKNFSRSEDILLLSAWLNTTKDAVTGGEAGSFWHRIHDYFVGNGETGIERTKASLKSRWVDINARCATFLGIHAQIESTRQSETVESEMLKEVRKTYQSVVGKRFQYEHCWEILRHEPKWSDNLSTKRHKGVPNPTVVNSSPSTPRSPDISDADQFSPKHEKASSRKTSKTLDKNQNVEHGKDSSNHQNLQEREELEKRRALLHERQIIQQEQALSQHRQQIEIEQKNWDLKVMLTDTSSMDEANAAYWNSLKVSILEKARP